MQSQTQQQSTTTNTADPSSTGQQASRGHRTRIAQNAVVCSECELVGEVSIGPNTVIHPKARILAQTGAIIIGAFNIVEELALIVNNQPNAEPLVIGDNNVFEVSSTCEALQVGDNNVLEFKSHVGSKTRIGNGCVVGAMCSLTSPELLPDCTVVYGSDVRRRVASEKPPAQLLQIDFLSKILPNFHHLLKANRSTAPAAAGATSPRTPKKSTT